MAATLLIAFASRGPSPAGLVPLFANQSVCPLSAFRSVRSNEDSFFSRALIIERAAVTASSRVPKTVLSSGNRLPEG
jgi:hypothetical protein